VEIYRRADGSQMTMRYDTFALHAGYLRLQAHTKNIQYLLLFDGNNGYANAPQCYVYMSIACLVQVFIKGVIEDSDLT